MNKILEIELNKAIIIAKIRVILIELGFIPEQIDKDLNSYHKMFYKRRVPNFKYIDATFWNDFVYLFDKEFFYNDEQIFSKIRKFLKELMK